MDYEYVVKTCKEIFKKKRDNKSYQDISSEYSYFKEQYPKLFNFCIECTNETYLISFLDILISRNKKLFDDYSIENKIKTNMEISDIIGTKTDYYKQVGRPTEQQKKRYYDKVLKEEIAKNNDLKFKKNNDPN